VADGDGEIGDDAGLAGLSGVGIESAREIGGHDEGAVVLAEVGDAMNRRGDGFARGAVGADT